MLAADFIVEDHGSILTFTANTDDAKTALADLSIDDWQYNHGSTSPAFSVDHRVGQHLMEHFQEHGFIVRVTP
jgi:hypothetical protein